MGKEDPPENEMATHSSTLAWRIPWKAMMNLDSASLPAKVCIVKAMVFPVVMYGCERWTTKRPSTEELMLSNCGARKDS